MTANKPRPRKRRPIRVGVIGVGRGSSFASGATDLVGMKLVALCDTWEKRLKEAGKRYDVAAYTRFHMEMRRLYRTGEIGEVTYAEGEYNHPMAPQNRVAISQGRKHWRNWIPSTYYCTHALAPLMMITERMPVKVNGLSMACREIDAETVRVGDPGSVILCRMDNGAVFRIFGPGQVMLGCSSSIAPGVPIENIKTLIEGFRAYRERAKPE